MPVAKVRVPPNVLRFHEWLVSKGVFPVWHVCNDCDEVRAEITLDPAALFDELVRLTKAVTEELMIKLATTEMIDGSDEWLPCVWGAWNGLDPLATITFQAIDDRTMRRAIMSLVS